MIPITVYDGKTIGVLGLGRSGMATARALQAGGATAICWDDNEAARDRAAAEGFRVEDLAAPPRDIAFAAYVMSPGAPHLYPAPHPAAAYALAQGIPLDNDIGLFFEQLEEENETLAGEAVLDAVGTAPFEDLDAAREMDMASLEALAEQAEDLRVATIAITGSNGKSTTAALIHHVLTQAGRGAHLAGNIGRGVFDLPKPSLGDVIVLELSSYQTDLARRLSPDVAVFTNLSPDHLDRHGGLGGYFAAKARLLLSAQINAVIGVDENEGAFLANRLLNDLPHPVGGGADLRLEPLIAISGRGRVEGYPAGVSFQNAPALELRGGGVSTLTTLSLSGAPALQGAHNAQNAACAVAACAALGLGYPEIQAGLDSFPGLPHRMQIIADAGGVRFVNDSKATNAGAAEKALLTFDRIRWIVGGLAKDGGIDSLAPLFPRVLKAYLIGASQEAFAPALAAAGVDHERCGDMETAVARAQAEAQPGETVLLAPACASFDQFPDFEKRGDAFVGAVKRALGQIDDA